MLRKRLVTVLTINNGVLFRTRGFVPDYRYTLNFTDAWLVDEVVLLDITRPGEGARENFYELVRQFARNCFVPLTVGGGVRDIEDFKTLLSLGADKVSVNSKACEMPEFISEAARLFGSQCVVLSVDAKRESDSNFSVYSAHGTRQLPGHTAADWARKAQKLGAGEILLQSIDRDGTLEGYDNGLNKSVTEAVEIPVLVSGGAGCWEHFLEGFLAGGASAVCTTNVYHFTESSIKSAKTYLANAGVAIRTS